MVDRPAIPASRDRIRDALRELELASTQLLLDKCLGLSLSDQYWICPTSSGVRWEEVNFFQNAFSDDVGNILLGRGSSSGPGKPDVPGQHLGRLAEEKVGHSG